MYLKHELGILGEQIATNYLKSQNYEILNRNFSCKQGEIDIIAKVQQPIAALIYKKTCLKHAK